MRISRYGLVLQSLNAQHIENVRVWRNRESNRLAMEFDQKISENQQLLWFQNVDHTKNLLFTYHFENQIQGFVQLKEIDFEKGEAEAGIIHGNDATNGTSIPIIAIISLMEIAFDLLGLTILKAKIKAGNTPVELLNKHLGYKMISNQEKFLFPYYEVSKTDFGTSTEKFRKMLKNAHGKSFEIGFDITTSDAFWKQKIKAQKNYTLIDSKALKTNA